MAALMRAQLRLGARGAAGLARRCSAGCRCCSALVPGHQRLRLWRCRCPGWCSGVLVYPVPARSPRWYYVRHAERIERDFADLVGAAVNATYGVVAIVLVCLGDRSVIGAFGLRLSRTTSDFYVARRTVSAALERLGDQRRVPLCRLVPRRRRAHLRPRHRHAVVPGRLHRGLPGAAGPRRGPAAPLRRLHAARLRRGPAASRGRSARLSQVLVVGIGWLYLLPQFQGAGLALQHRHRGARRWVGGLVVAVVVLANVAAGGMRSITLVQAIQYWLKLTAIWRPGLPPARGSGAATAAPAPTSRRPASPTGSQPLSGFGGRDHPRLRDVLARCWRSASARWACRTCWSASTPTPTAARPAARRSSVVGLLGAFYLFTAAVRRARAGLPARPAATASAPTRWC